MHSVGTKLIAVVAICILPSFAATWVISGLFERSQRDAALAHISAAGAGFTTELLDDISDLRVAVSLLSTDPDVFRELGARDKLILGDHIDDFTDVYPDMRVLLTAPNGDVLATTDSVMVNGRLKLPWTAFQGVTLLPHPDGTQDRTYSYAVVRPVQRAGEVVGIALASFPLNSAYLANTSEKTGLALAFRRNGEILGRTSNSKVLDTQLALNQQDEIRTPEGHTYAVGVFSPPQLAPIEVVAALDISGEVDGMSVALRRRLAVLAATGLVALLFAWWLSRGMARAVTAIARVLPGIAEHRYVKVETVKTNDELETLATVYNQMIARILDNQRWRSALGKYLSPAAQAAVESGEVHLGGSVMPATVLFSDIRSFTSLSEKLPPEQVLALLNRYFTEMVAAVTRHGGTVDKFIGDCVMAVWGPPTPGAEDALCAVKAGLAMRDALAALNRDFERDSLPVLRTGIGIHSGMVVAGNIGAEGKDGRTGRMEYTVIGDTVNLASRLEAMTKELHTDFLISESTYALVRDHIQVEPLAQVTVRGRTQPVQIYRVLALAAEAAPAAARLEPRVAG